MMQLMVYAVMCPLSHGWRAGESKATLSTLLLNKCVYIKLLISQ